MSTETPEPDAGRCRCADGCSGRGGENDLSAVSRRANPRSCVNGQPDVSIIGECRSTAVDSDADAHFQTVCPCSLAELTLDRHGRLDGRSGPLEDGKELVGSGIDLAAARSGLRCPEDASHVVQECAVAVAQPAEQDGGTLDI